MDFNGVNSFLDAAGQTIKAIPETYKDGLQPTVKESGKTLSLIPRAINAALVPLQKWILYKEYSYNETELILKEKLKNIDPQKIVTPEPYVGVPVLQAISYCMDCNELRNLYANLLAKSMNIDTKDNAHPAYAEIIKQLSPLDATILNNLALHEKPIKTFPIGMVRFAKENHTPNLGLYLGSPGMTVMKHFIELENIKFSEDICISIQNLERLGLISTDYSRALVDVSAYDKLKNSKFIHEAKAFYDEYWKVMPQYADYKIVLQNGLLESTPLGFSFSKVCCVN
ncbi:DUF4393 domain-containing protein [Clostridium ihumii]|uniref:DUF4393 domain-containing protein n=1 Tax=Clostridium ihumii TaxID=1470356 RepID=UPI00068642D6|nr:DUF4393 domain-containing protein [Clostridium ihumii]